MIINQQSDYHWQLVLVTNQAVDKILATGILYLFLQKHFPNIQHCKNHRIDLDKLSKQDIFGTCLMQRQDRLVSHLKQTCYDSLIGKDIPHWDSVLNALSETSSVHIYAYAKSISLSTQKRIFINAHISEQRNQTFDNEVFIAKTKETVKGQYIHRRKDQSSIEDADQ